MDKCCLPSSCVLLSCVVCRHVKVKGVSVRLNGPTPHSLHFGPDGFVSNAPYYLLNLVPTPSSSSHSNQPPSYSAGATKGERGSMGGGSPLSNSNRGMLHIDICYVQCLIHGLKHHYILAGLTKNAYHTILINGKFLFIQFHTYRKLYEISITNIFP